jgi:probable addiction module antidote protein
MAKKKTSTKHQKQQKKYTPKKIKIGSIVFTEFSPTEELANNPKMVFDGLVEALMDGDKEAFQEILEGYIKAREITKTANRVKLSRTVIYEAIDKNSNPSLESICKIMKAFKNSEVKKKAA